MGISVGYDADSRRSAREFDSLRRALASRSCGRSRDRPDPALGAPMSRCPRFSQVSTRPALRPSGELQRPPRSMVASASATPVGARAPGAGIGTCPTDPTATAHQRSMAGILSHRSVYRWPMLLGDGPPGICTSSLSPASSYVWGNSNGRFDAHGRWTWSVAGNGS